jgi:hypothetical protein
VFPYEIYDRGHHMSEDSRYVAIVKHKFGHFFEDTKFLSMPHLHVYKVDHRTFTIRDGVHATSYDHYYWKEPSKEEDKNRYDRLISSLLDKYGSILI